MASGEEGVIVVAAAAAASCSRGECCVVDAIGAAVVLLVLLGDKAAYTTVVLWPLRRQHNVAENSLRIETKRSYLRVILYAWPLRKTSEIVTTSRKQKANSSACS